MGPFMNPETDADSHGSSMDQSIESYEKDNGINLKNLELALGKIPQKAGGRTLNIPKYLPENIIPGSSSNGAVTVGSQCLGSHCSISVTPTSHNYTNNIIPSIKDSPPGIESQVVGTDRLGNKSFLSTNIKTYKGTFQNPGPF